MRPIQTLAILAALSFSVVAMADPITTLYSTGLDSSGATGAAGSVDAHYKLVSIPAGATPTVNQDAIVSTTNTAWAQPTGAARWINNTGFSANSSPADQPGGLYEYVTTFSLAGFNPATGSITITWATDDSGCVKLNGISEGCNSLPAYGATQTLVISNGADFLSGTNTLEFDVINNDTIQKPGPTGLYADVAGSADASAPTVPEPSSLLMLGTGMISVVGAARRKFRHA